MSKIKCKQYQSSLKPFKYVQGKRDGIYLRIENRKAYSSQGTDITHQVRDYQWFKSASKSDHIFVGELFVKSKPASAVKHHLASYKPLEFNCFGIPDLNHDFSLEHIESICKGHNIIFTPYINLENHKKKVTLADCNPHVMYDQILNLTHDKDYEGVVYKNGNILDWYKWKPVKTIDGFIIDSTPGRGKFEGLVGSVEIAIFHNGKEIEIASVGGFDDHMREVITSMRDNIFDRVIEVKYQYIGAKGRLRHPRFLSFRDDKKANECLSDQDVDLFNFLGKTHVN